MSELDKYGQASNAIEKVTAKPSLLLVPAIAVVIILIMNPWLLVLPGLVAGGFVWGKVSK